MKLIRWPAVALLLLALLVGFFWIGQAGDDVVRRNLESFGSYELKTLFKVGAADVSVFQSYVRVDSIHVMDPGQRGRPLFTAEQIDLRADIGSFFERRAGLKDVHVEQAAARILQTRTGRFVLLSDTARAVLAYEPIGMRVNRIMSWAADQVNPLNILGVVAPLLGGTALEAPTSTVARTPEFRLPLGTPRPEFFLDLLTISNCTLELVPYGGEDGVPVHGLRGYCTGISSMPRNHDQPIAFAAFGYVGAGMDAWVAAAGELDFRGGITNITVDFAFSNIALRTALPFARAYTRFLDSLNVQSGTLSARGRVQLDNRIVQPTVLDLRVDGVTARAAGFENELAWLNMLAISNTTLAMQVPLDNRPPYVHVDTALKQQNLSTQIEKFEMRINVRDLQQNFLKDLNLPRSRER